MFSNAFHPWNLNSTRVSWGSGVRCLGGFLVGLSGVAHAGLLIHVGDVQLLPNLPNQSVPFFVENTGDTDILVAGFSWNMQVADGGVENFLTPGVIPGPSITAVDILTGTPFQSNNTDQFTGGNIPQFANWTTTTSSGSIALTAGETFLLGTAIFDTTGFNFGDSFDLFLGNTINGPTKYFDLEGGELLALVFDGTLAVIPEPHQTAAVAVCLLGVGLALRKTRRSTK
jgi:hypothetical protein